MRLIERFLSLLLALALAAAAVLLALEVVWSALGKDPLVVPWPDALDRGRTDTWDSSTVRGIAIGVLVVGLLLLLVALKPRRAPRLPLVRGESGVDAALTRRSLRRTLLTTAQQVDGISSAHAKVSRRKATVTATSRLGSADTAKGLRGELESALQGRLDGLQLARTPRLRTRVQSRTGARSR